MQEETSRRSAGFELHSLGFTRTPSEHDPRRNPALLSAIGRIAPGTDLRQGIDDIIRSREGALIVIGAPSELSFLFSGGIRLDQPFTPQLLYELARPIVDLRDGVDGRPPAPAGWPFTNSTLLPRNPALSSVDYAVFFSEEFAPNLGFPDPDAPGEFLDLCTLVNRGLIHELWLLAFPPQVENDKFLFEVLETKPGPGTRVPAGRPVVLTVSLGQTIADVPTDLAGKALEAATAELADAGFTATTAETPYDEYVPKGSVVRVAEGVPASLEKGSEVPLVVSNGPQPRTVPSGLVGSTEAAATDALESIGLKAAIVRSYSDTVPEGQVISVLPASGSTVARGTSINVEVSRGPELVAVPSVRNAGSISKAISIIRAAGLTPGSVSGPAAGTPVGTSPGAGTKVKKGSRVNIILG